MLKIVVWIQIELDHFCLISCNRLPPSSFAGFNLPPGLINPQKSICFFFQEIHFTLEMPPAPQPRSSQDQEVTFETFLEKFSPPPRPQLLIHIWIRGPLKLAGICPNRLYPSPISQPNLTNIYNKWSKTKLCLYPSILRHCINYILGILKDKIPTVTEN